MKKILIADATASEVASFASINLGIPDIHYKLGKAAILIKMGPVWDKDYIEVEDSVPDVRRVDPPKTTGKRRMVDLMIPNQDYAGGGQPVPLSVNGSQMFVERNKRSMIPYEYFIALQNAQKAVYDQGPNGELIMPPRMVPEYPYMVYSIDPEPETEEQKVAA